MRRFLIGILLFILVIIAVLAVSLFFIPNNKIPDNSLFASYDKHQRLSSLESPKLILVGGSNLPFGIKSEMIEDSLGLPVVNMGLHAGLGLNFILSEVERDIHEGDVVVTSLEYHHFLSPSMYQGEDVLAALLFDVNRDCMKYISVGQWVAMLPNISLYASKKLINISPQTVNDFESLFTRESFNKQGDEVAHYGMPSSVHSGGKKDLSEKTYNKAIRRLMRFSELVDAKKAKLVLVACPYPQQQYYMDSIAIGNVESELNQLGLSFFIRPKECVFPDSLMFNSYYHLTEEGAGVRTQQLIKVLEQCQ